MKAQLDAGVSPFPLPQKKQPTKLAEALPSNLAMTGPPARLLPVRALPGPAQNLSERFMSAPALNSNLSLLVIPGFSLVGKMIDSRPDWTAVDFCALQSDSAGIRPITRSRAWRQGAGRLGGGPCGGGLDSRCQHRLYSNSPPRTPHPNRPLFIFLRPQGTVACGGREAAARRITGSAIRSGR